MSNRRSVVVAVLALLYVAAAVEKHKFKTCEQSGFCKRNRAMTTGQSPFEYVPQSVKVSDYSIQMEIVNSATGDRLGMDISGLQENTLRFKMREINVVRRRFEAVHALVDHIDKQKIEIQDRTPESLTFTMKNNKIVIDRKPFKVTFFIGDVPVIVANERGLMRFEPFKEKPQEGEEAAAVENPEPGLGEESFSGNTDSKPYGPSSVGMDFSFPAFQHVYGLGEHADSFSLKDTKSGDPYRLYNLDVFEYELESTMALYGAIPFIIAHNERQSVGLYWQNAAETWVDVQSQPDSSVVSSIVNLVAGSQSPPQKDLHFMSETGLLDFFVMLGPGPKDVLRQYAKLTGTTPLPPAWALAYHQCRWNYNDQDDVRMVSDGFDKHDIPMDVMWLDIEHTDGKQYFTWDPVKFADPEDMINNLTAKGRKMVTIVDPHIKKVHGYYIHNECHSNRYYIKNKDGNDHEGWCWPGASYYPDFVNEKVREWWAEQFLVHKYQGSTLDLYTWNDMNEPSVFNGPETTLPKDTVHLDGWEHREVHNMYGFYHHWSTFQGHLLRSQSELRPFILTRSFFSGSQRYAAVWTGDNMAKWEHLQASVPMLLQLSVGGISLCGADVGGFFYNPEEELVIRWYQAGSWQPFFRGHSHIDTKRREPWVYSQETKELIRAAIRQRYTYLSYWYTLFYQGESSGVPPMRPLWLEFPQDSNTFNMEDQYLVGPSLLVHPVLDKGQTSVDVYLPGEDEVWYDVDNLKKYEQTQTVFTFPVILGKVPVFQRGGSIIPKKERVRRASSLMKDDPYTLIVALDKSGTAAKGTLYIDDGESYKYQKDEFLYLNLIYKDGSLVSYRKSDTQPIGSLKTKSWVERIVIAGLKQPPSKVFISASGPKKPLEFSYNSGMQVLIVRKPGVNMGATWKLQLE